MAIGSSETRAFILVVLARVNRFWATYGLAYCENVLMIYFFLQAKGVDLIVCLSVNDAFVMSAWGEEHKADGKIRMLADTKGDFTKVQAI